MRFFLNAVKPSAAARPSPTTSAETATMRRWRLVIDHTLLFGQPALRLAPRSANRHDIPDEHERRGRVAAPYIKCVAAHVKEVAHAVTISRTHWLARSRRSSSV